MSNTELNSKSLSNESTSNALVVSNLDKSFGGFRVLKSTNFSLPRAKVTCLVGPNGAGKTTVFDCITGFLRHDSGAIFFNDRDLSVHDRSAIVKAGIARSFQNLRLFEEMTVIDNVIVCLTNESGNNPFTALFRPFYSASILREKREKAMSILGEVGLTEKAEHHVNQISFGQQKLLCIARVLATDASILLLDEPTSGLSATALENMISVIKKLSASGKTLLIVEHNTKIVREIADHIVFMHQGCVLAEGSPLDVLDRRDLAEIYFGGH